MQCYVVSLAPVVQRLDNFMLWISHYPTVSICANISVFPLVQILFDRLQKLQNRAARVLTFSSYDADANRLIRQLDWKDLSTQFQIQKSIMVYKSLNGLVPEYLSSKFVKRNETRYSLRDSVNKLFVPFPRTNFMKNSFSYSGAVLWNSLPCHVREAESLSQFKRLVNVHF